MTILNTWLFQSVYNEVTSKTKPSALNSKMNQESHLFSNYYTIIRNSVKILWKKLYINHIFKGRKHYWNVLASSSLFGFKQFRKLQGMLEFIYWLRWDPDPTPTPPQKRRLLLCLVTWEEALLRCEVKGCGCRQRKDRSKQAKAMKHL